MTGQTKFYLASERDLDALADGEIDANTIIDNCLEHYPQPTIYRNLENGGMGVSYQVITIYPDTEKPGVLYFLNWTHTPIFDGPLSQDALRDWELLPQLPDRLKPKPSSTPD